MPDNSPGNHSHPVFMTKDLFKSKGEKKKSKGEKAQVYGRSKVKSMSFTEYRNSLSLHLHWFLLLSMNFLAHFFSGSCEYYCLASVDTLQIPYVKVIIATSLGPL